MAAGLVRIRIVYFLHEWPGGRRRPEWTGFVIAVAVCVLVLLLLLAALCVSIHSLLV